MAVSPMRATLSGAEAATSGSVLCSFWRRTIDRAARVRASAWCAALVTLFSWVLVLFLSKTPTAKRGVKTRFAASSTRDRGTLPSATAFATLLSPMKSDPGISWSRPATIDIECVAPQSLITQPLKPRRSLRSRCSVSGFSHDHPVPGTDWALILLYEHMKLPTFAAIAPSNGG